MKAKSPTNWKQHLAIFVVWGMAMGLAVCSLGFALYAQATPDSSLETCISPEQWKASSTTALTATQAHQMASVCHSNCLRSKKGTNHPSCSYSNGYLAIWKQATKTTRPHTTSILPTDASL